MCVKDDGSFVWHDRYTQYVYHKSGETWSYSHTLTRTASNYNSINNNLSFGGDYFASGNLGFYPSGNSASNIGAVFLYYIKNSTTWNYTRIDHPVAANGQHYQFGVSVSINNDILATCAAVERKIYIYSLSNDGNNATATSLTTIEGPTGTQYKYGYTISFVNNYLITGYQGTDGKILFYEKENDSTWTEDTSKTISAPTGDFSSPIFGKYSYGKGSTLITGIESQGILFYNIASEIPAPQSSQVGKSFVDQNFSNCNFKGVDFSGATFTNCDFTGTVLSESSLKYITSSGITPTNGKGVSLPSGYYLTKGFLVGPNITTPTVGGNPLDPLPATTPNKTFSGTIENMNLSFINFTGSSLAGVELSGNVFSNTTFSDLSGVYLNNQDLTGAVLSSANMQNVKSNNVSPPSGNGITLPPGYFVSKGFVFGPGVDTTGHPSAASASNFASENYQTTANSISSSQTSGNYPWMIQYEKNTGTIIVSDKASLTNDGTTANGGTYYDSTPTTYRYKKKSRIFSYENGKDFITTDLSNVAMEECHNTVLSYVNSGKMTYFASSISRYYWIESVLIRHYSSTSR